MGCIKLMEVSGEHFDTSSRLADLKVESYPLRAALPIVVFMS